MSSILIERDGEERDALIGWWHEGDHLEPDATVICAADEVVLFVDGDEIVAELGPGRHRLTADTQPSLAKYLREGPPDIDVGFVKTRSVTLAVDGLIGECTDEETAIESELSLTSSFRVKVTNPALAVALNDELEEDVSVEEFLIDTFLGAATDALESLEPTVKALRESGGKIPGWGEATLARIQEELDGSGIEIELAEDLVAGLEEEEDEDDDDSPN